MKKLLLLAIVVLGISALSFGQDPGVNPTQTKEAATSATIITPISISNTSGSGDLLFGKIIADADGGSLTVNPDGSTVYSGVNAPAAIVGTIQAASFVITGQPGAAYTIVPGNDFVVTESITSETMGVSDVTPSKTSSNLPIGGSETITVGATLTLGNNQQSGLYESSDGLTITVAYN